MVTIQSVRGSLARRFLLAIVATLSIIAGLVSTVMSPPRAEASTLSEVTQFGTNPGGLKMFNYIPGQPRSGMALVVALHGCQQTAGGYGDDSGWVRMAATYQFALVLPQQTTANNSMSCFNWFEPSDIARDSGESLSIRQMIDSVRARHLITPSRIFVTGLSAGAFMTANLLAAYPDMFAGGAVIAGGPTKCATSSIAAFRCMNPGMDKTPRQWGDLARASFQSWTGTRPKVSLWHGTADYVVNVKNLTESMEQWTNVNGVDQTADVSDTVNGYPHKVYQDSSGSPAVETYQLTNQGHGQPLDPGTGAEQCGVAGATAMTDMNICAAYHVAKFFGLTS